MRINYYQPFFCKITILHQNSGWTAKQPLLVTETYALVFIKESEANTRVATSNSRHYTVRAYPSYAMVVRISDKEVSSLNNKKRVQ